MTHYLVQNLPRLYLTAPSPCPYLPGRLERKMFTQLGVNEATSLNSLLTQSGFRRSQNIAYRPACEGCAACISVRIRAGAFDWTRSFTRTWRRNRDLLRARVGAHATEEQYALLRRYLDARHGDGGMADMTFYDYRSMIEESTVDCHLVEYRAPRNAGERLIGVALTDSLEDGLSMVYSFFDPDLPARSLGTHIVLDHVAEAAARGLPYVYLGYWVKGSEKMDYKSRFRPMEALTPRGWQPLNAIDPKA